MGGVREKGLRVLLTGATGGIGREIALALAAQGAELLATGRDEQRLETLCAELTEIGGRARCVTADLTSAEGRRRVVAEARARPGGINVLVNNAAISAFGHFARQTDEEIERIVTTNLLATMLLTKALLPVLQNQSWASIVNVGSMLGSLATPGQVAYSASKYALRGFTEGLRRELADSPVRIVYVAPRATDTAMNGTRLRRFNARFGVAMDSPTAVAAGIVRAIARGPAEHFLGWPEKLFVRINALLPGIIDRALRAQSRHINDPEVTGESLVLPTGADQ